LSFSLGAGANVNGRLLAQPQHQIESLDQVRAASTGRSPYWIKSKNPNAPLTTGGGVGLDRMVLAKEMFEPVTLGNIRSDGCRNLLV
jgi:hypothetical protein